MKTRWLAFAVARSQLVACTRYSNERCVSNVAAEVLPELSMFDAYVVLL